MPSRRTVLRRSAAGGVLGGIVSLAGCTAPTIDFEAERREAGLGDVGDPTYRNWLPAAEPEIERLDLDDPTIQHLDVDRYLDRGGALSPEAAAGSLFPWSLWGSLRPTSVFEYEMETLDELLFLSSRDHLTALELGGVPETAIRETLADRGYDTVASVGEWTVFQTTTWMQTFERISAVAVSPDGVIATSSEVNDSAQEDGDLVTDAIDRVLALIETGAGDRPRRHERNEEFAWATDTAGSGILTSNIPFFWITEGRVDDEFGDPSERELLTSIDTLADGSGFGYRSSIVLSEARQPYESDAERELDYFEANEAWLSAIDDAGATVARDGRRVELFDTTTVESQLGDSRRAIPPRVWFTVDYNRDANRVVVTHDGGHAVSVSELAITASDDGPIAFEASADPLEPGDQLTIEDDLSRDQGLNIDWDSGLEELPTTSLASVSLDDVLPPTATFSLDGLHSDGTASIGYDDGDVIQTDRLTVVDETETPIDIDYDTIGDDLEPGDAIEIGENVADRVALIVIWEPAHPNTGPIELARFDTPFED